MEASSNPKRYSELVGNGTTVTSALLNVLTCVRTILHFEGQFGSGQAISASVDIQSFLADGRCLAARSGSIEAVE